MSIRAVIFDVGGVLSRRDDLTVVGRWADRLGLSIDELTDAIFENEVSRRANVGQATTEEVWQFVGQRFGLSAADTQTLSVEFWHGGAWDAALLDFIRTLRPARKTGVISNAWPTLRTAIGDYVNGTLFDAIVVSGEEGIEKPDPRIYRRALARLNVAPTQAVFVDDRQENVEGACRLGIHGLLFTDTNAILQQITALLADQH